MEFRCDLCGGCCTRHRVPVTGADLKRLTSFTGRAPDDFVELLSGDDIDMTGEPESFALLPEGRRLLVLAHTSGGCVFLERNRGNGARCVVHPARPRACRAWPFGIGEPFPVPLPQADCPPEAMGDPPPELAEELRLLQAELAENAEFIEGWNRSARLRFRLARLPRSSKDLLAALTKSSSTEILPNDSVGSTTK